MVPVAQRIKLAVYDLRGREVRRLTDATLPAGEHRLAWDGDDDAGRPLPSGPYLLHLVTGRGTTTLKVLLLE